MTFAGHCGDHGVVGLGIAQVQVAAPCRLRATALPAFARTTTKLFAADLPTFITGYTRDRAHTATRYHASNTFDGVATGTTWRRPAPPSSRAARTALQRAICLILRYLIHLRALLGCAQTRRAGSSRSGSPLRLRAFAARAACRTHCTRFAHTARISQSNRTSTGILPHAGKQHLCVLHQALIASRSHCCADHIIFCACFRAPYRIGSAYFALSKNEKIWTITGLDMLGCRYLTYNSAWIE